MTFLRLAWRNVLRNTRRSAITIAAIVIGLAALIFLWAFIDGVNDQMIENSTRYVSGHIQVHRAGYHEERTLDLLLADADRVAARLRREPHVIAMARRLEGSAIASVSDKSRGVLVVGVDPEQEMRVTTLYQTIKAGRFLSAEDGNTIVIGDNTAEALNAAVGSEVALVTQAADGSIGAGRYWVRGIFDTKMDMLDGVYVFLPLAAAQELYAAGEKTTSVVARLDGRDAAAPIVARLQRDLGATHEVLGWRALLPNVVQSVDFHEVTGYILLLVLFIVVAVGVTNTVLMAVMERTREFGVMMALGTTPFQVTRLVFYEACLLGVAGLLLGALAGVVIAEYYAMRGIDLGQFGRAMETMQGLTSVIHPLPRLDRTLILSGLVFTTAMIAALYPAWKAVSLQPIEAIRGLARAIRWRRPAFASPMPWPLFWKIAARSIARNPRRTALTLSATAFGLAAFVFLLSFVDGYLGQMVANSTGYITGDAQVQHPEFRRDMAPEFALHRPAALLQAIAREPSVAAAAPRVQAQVLVSSPQQSQNVMLFGIDPASEREVTFIDRAIRVGKPLASGQDRDIVMGKKLAEKLGVKLGEKVVVMAQAADGSLGSGAFRLSGIFATESEAFDATMAYVTLAAAQGLLALGSDVSTIAVRVRDRDKLDVATASLQAALGGTPYSIVSWHELLPEVAQMIDYLKVIVRLIVAIVFAVVAMGVMNTLLMSVMERTREFGIMMALGTPPSAIVRLVLYEALVLSVIGTLVGYLLGVAVVEYYTATGIDVSRYTEGLQTIPGQTGIIYPRLAMAGVVPPTLVLLAVGVVAALYPSWRAAALDPTQAIRRG